MQQQTHKKVSIDLVGRPLEIENDHFARVSLVTTQEMAADEAGLIHGGFTFSLADYAAMLAINQPNVILMSAEVRYLQPVKLGDILLALARVTEKQERKRLVEVEIRVADQEVFEGKFLCYLPKKHILAKAI